ncbi:MAG TPA: DUF4350 domain-containing protein [Gemmataceae bacterium]|jgi:hypothetical protein
MRRVILTLLVAATAAAPAGARPPAGHHKFGEGTEAFRAVFKKVGTKSLDTPDKLLDNPANTVLVVLGDVDVLEPLFADGSFRQFLNRGGAVLIATDRPTSASFERAVRVHISGEFIHAAPNDSYRGELVECPILRDRLGPNGPRHAIFSALPVPSHVATNRPSYIDHNPLLLPVIAWLPVMGRQFLGNQNLRFDLGAAPLMFGVTRTFGSGRLLVLADHSIFINDMMLQADNDNIPFAFNVAHWLTDAGGDKRRTEVLFYEDGQIQTNFDVSLEYPSLPPIRLEELVPLANEAVTGLERENAFNNVLLEMTGGPRAILRTLAFLLTLALVAVGLYRFLHARYRPEPRVPRVPAQVAALAPAVPAVERRHQAVIAQGNLAEAARELAHQAFAALGVPPTPDDPPPAVTVDGSWWERFRIGRRVRDLWAVAARGPARRVSPAGLRRLDAALRDLHAAVAAGKVRLAAANSPI